MATPTRRRLTAEERRTAILDAALSAFSAKGYHATSLDDVAGEAGVSKALIYEHFASKQELYGDLIARNARELTQRVAGALSGVEVESTVERLATGLEAFFAFVEERRDAWRMLMRDASDPETAAVLDRMVQQVTAEVTVLISAGSGRARADPRGGRARAAGCSPRCSSAACSRWRTGGRTTPTPSARSSWPSRWTSPGSGSSG